MQTATTSLAAFLDELAATMKEAAEAARAIHDREVDLPATLTPRHIANFEGCSTSTVWRKAKLGQLGPLLSGPDEPIRIDRNTYLAYRRRRGERVAEQVAELAAPLPEPRRRPRRGLDVDDAVRAAGCFAASEQDE